MSENFIISLIVMGKGMLGIFTVILILMFFIMLLQKIAGKAKAKEVPAESSADSPQ